MAVSPDIIGLVMEKGKKVVLREDRAIQETIPRHAPDAVRVWTHIARIQIISHKVKWLKVNS